MCRRLEKTNKGGLYSNRLSGGRCALGCIGLLFVVAIGAAAGALAYYLPDMFSEEGRYSAVFAKVPNNNAVTLSNDSCINYDKLLSNFEDKLVFKCGGNSKQQEWCIPIDLYCDGYYDCDDESDEASCKSFCREAEKPINSLRFSCPTSNKQTAESTENFTIGPESPECYSTNFYCDGGIDCLNDDGFDEKFPNCPVDAFTFGHPNGREARCSEDNSYLCADSEYCTRGRCNGFAYCLDGSDELYC